MADETSAINCGSHSKSGNPCPKLTAPDSVAKADMTEKMVVPMAGCLETSWGVMVGVMLLSQLVIVDMACHGLGHQGGRQTVAEEFCKLENKIAQVSASLECNAGHIVAQQVA